MPTTFSNVKWWNNICVIPFGIIFNTILLYLIKYKSAPNLADYKKVLYLGCCTDLIFGTWYFFTNPDTTFINGVYFVFTRGILGYLPFPWTVWTWPFTILTLYFSFINVLIQFVYRYFLVCWKVKLTGWKFFCLFVAGFSLVLAHPIYEWYHLFVRVRTDKDFVLLLNGTEWVIDGETPVYGAFSMKNDGPREDHTITWGNMQNYKIAYITLAYATIIFCGICIFYEIRKSENLLSKDAKKYQWQISIVMTVEGIVPIFTMVFPILLDLITIVTGIRVPWGGALSLLLTGLAPVINPFVKIFVISCYRKWILKILRFRIHLEFSVATSNNVVQTTASPRMSVMSTHH